MQVGFITSLPLYFSSIPGEQQRYHEDAHHQFRYNTGDHGREKKADRDQNQRQNSVVDASLEGDEQDQEMHYAISELREEM